MSIFKKGTKSSPIHYIFLATIISIKDQYQLKEDLERILGAEIIVDRENGCAIFKTDRNHQENCIAYCQSHMDELILKYNIKMKDLEG